jgi:hypothetical protein
MNPPDRHPRRSLAPWLGFGVLGIALVAVFVAVLERRFSAGDIYPHYSTLRSDPLGAQALYESLDALPGLELSRNLRDLMTLDTLDGDSALWLCGLSRPTFDELRGPADSAVLRAVKEKGARLIITINPGSVPEKYDLAKEDERERQAEEWFERREEARRKKSGDKAEKDESETKEPNKKKREKRPADFDDEEDDDLPEELVIARGPLITELFAVELNMPEKFERPEEGWALAPGKSPNPKARPLPGELPLWRSQYRFDSLGDEWTVAALVGDDPVVIERPFGKGTIALASDSYFSSNEALWKDPPSGFLLWLNGGKSKIVFDETIHGSVESSGAMKMIRRYRFHGFFIGFFIFVALMAWRSGSSLAPGSEALERGLADGDAIAGENTESGFVRLLRRGVPRKRLLRTCLDTWRKTAARRSRGENVRQRDAIEAILASHEADPKNVPAAVAYRQIAEAIAHPDRYGK